MPIDVEALLRPISAQEPSGADLRYNPLSDQIKEARREEDDINQGVWKHDLKVADYTLVTKLATEALTKKTKDLQIAAWLSEALLHREGFGGLLQGMELIRRLLEEFWETIYPEIDEDGDLELRATPLRWIGSQLDRPLREAPLTEAGHNWFQYKESRTIPTEPEAKSDSAKLKKRTDAIAAGILAPEEFDKGLEMTSLAFSQRVYDKLTGLGEFLQEFGPFCDEKFGEASPDFSRLRTAIEEVQQTSRMLLIKKGGLQTSAPQQQPVVEAAVAPSTAAAQPAAPAPTPAPPAAAPAVAATAPAAAPAPVAISAGPEPASVQDAIERLAAVSRYFRKQNPYSPVSYLLLRAMRWGELRAAGKPHPTFLEAPPVEVRVELKRLAAAGNWNEVREKAEEAASGPCGRAWLDLQRYAITACRNCGQDAIAQALASELKALLADFPNITEWTLVDDTPAANPETMQWLKENNLLPGAEPPASAPAPAQPEPPVWTAPPPIEPPRDFFPSAANATGDGEPFPPDAYDLAMEAARSGRADEAFAILSREIGQENTGRGRFLRKVQLAQVCLATGNDEIARPILEDLAGEIEQRCLEAWEGTDVIAQPLALLYRTLANSGDSQEERRRLYARICRLDPVRALSLGR